MSYYDYVQGREISMEHHPFYALIQAAMRQADTNNLEKLQAAWPEVYADLENRYHAPNGLLDGEEAAV